MAGSTRVISSVGHSRQCRGSGYARTRTWPGRTKSVMKSGRTVGWDLMSSLSSFALSAVCAAKCFDRTLCKLVEMGWF